jgi:anti-sigma regulatory factor (Ser/Thr protein kinase)
MTSAEVRTFPARMECLAEAIAFVESYCDGCGISREDALRIALIVEELFTNTVLHGHRGDSDAPVRIGLRSGASEVDIAYEDRAPPFDPVEHVARAPVEAEVTVPDRSIGKLGIALVLGMSVRADYARDDGWNRLRLTLRRQAD